MQARDVKEIYVADYDGANQRRFTTAHKLNITPVWSPDARSIAWTAFQRTTPDILVSNIYAGMPPENLTGGRGQNWLPSWSPDGTRLCFVSTRDGNSELYVMNRDGSNLTRLTNHPAIDVSPTWSPSGTQIAFTSDRSGAPQIYIIDADGRNLFKMTAESWCDRPTWSPAPFNEIAYASTDRAGVQYQNLRSGHAGAPAAHLRRGEQREPGVRGRTGGTWRSCRRGPARSRSSCWDGTARVEAGHHGREQLHARLVEVAV